MFAPYMTHAGQQSGRRHIRATRRRVAKGLALATSLLMTSACTTVTRTALVGAGGPSAVSDTTVPSGDDQVSTPAAPAEGPANAGARTTSSVPGGARRSSVSGATATTVKG